MSPRTQEQLNEIKKDKKQLILNAGLEVFADKGFHSGSVNLIAKQAGISKGLIYTYFKDKNDLLKEIIAGGVQEMLSIFENPENELITEEQFLFYINESFEILKNNLYFWRLYFSLVMQKGILELFGNYFMEMLAPFINTMTKYYSNKNIENPYAHVALLGSVMDGVGIDYLMQPDEYPLEDVKKIIIEKFK
ncbi:MAG: TetR/AcrR family transcriptional regulator [Chlorobi bacterium]|nr:TetR/AcrR family transcriptional regulator [Chlorobiota bacterium]